MPYIAATVTPVVTAAQFRVDFPEFANAGTYPDNAVNYWLAVATLLFVPSRWLNVLQLGVELYVAHQIVLEAQAQQTAIKSGFPGESRGAIAAETVGDLTINYDSSMTLEEGAGQFNLTIYGTRLWQLIQIAGMGGLQIGPGCGGFPGAGFALGSSQNLVGAWSGPNCTPGNFSS